MLSPYTGYAVGFNGYKIEDGDTWIVDMVMPTYMSDVDFVSPSIGYAVGDQGTILKYTSVLPVALSTFNAQTQKSKVQLNWSTSMELNNSGFALMRKPVTSNTWEQIGFVRSFGKSNSTQSYSYVDEPKGGNDFLYQLKQIDLDGKSTLFNILKVKLEIEDVQMMVYPNPFKGQTTISYSVAKPTRVQLILRNQFGHIIRTIVNKKQQVGNYVHTLYTNELPTGIYYAELITETGKLTNKLNLQK